MGFTATFDGVPEGLEPPMDRHIAAPRVPFRFWFAPFPGGKCGPAPDGWMLVGVDEPASSNAWPGQISYALDESRSDVLAGEDCPKRGKATYVLVPLPEQAVMVQFTIYGPNNREHPGSYVVRRWVIHRGGLPPIMEPPAPVAVVSSLELARVRVPGNLFRIERAPDDNPAIVETWV